MAKPRPKHTLIKQYRISSRKLRHLQIENGIEVDESYFGPRRVKGRGGRGAGKKIIVLGLLKRKGKVYCSIIPNASKQDLESYFLSS